MKQYTLLSLFLLLSSYAFSQCPFTISANNPTYCPPATGLDITVNVTGGLAPYTYQLGQGVPQAGNVFPNVAAGTYTIYVTDASPCMDSIVVTGNAWPLPNITTTATFATVCNGGMTTVYGNGANTYIWTGGITDGIPFVPPATTTYTLTGADANGCTATSAVTITVSNTVPYNIISSTPPSCIPGCDGVVIVDSIPGVPPYSYSLSPLGCNLNAANNSFNCLCAGTSYVVQCTDANGCTGTTNVLLLANVPQINVVSTTGPSCVPGCDGTATTTTTGGVPGYTYTITAGATIDPNGLATNLCAGVVYTITCTDAASCNMTTTVQLIAPNSPIFNVNTVTQPSCFPGCDGTITTLTTGGTPAYTYTISGGAAINVMGGASNLCGGLTYTVTVTDANACTGTTTVQLTNPVGPALSITNITNVTCYGLCDATAQGIASGGVAPYTFSIFPAVPININTGAVTGLCPGGYTVTVSDANLCSVTASFFITQPPALNLSIVSSIQPSCIPGCDGSATTNITGGTPGYTYAISGGATINLSGTASNLCAGINYTITATDANACSVSTTLMLTGPNSPATPTISNIVIPTCVPGCDGSAQASTTGGTPPYTYSLGGVGAIDPNTGALSLLCGGIYTVVVVDAIGCSATASLYLNLPNTPTITISSSTMPSCIPGCDGTATTIGTGGVPPYNYSISGGATINIMGNASNLCAGFIYTITLTDANACTGTTTVLLANPPSPTITIGVVTDPPCNGMCNGTATTITAGGSPPYVYSISGGATINAMGNASNLCGGAIYTITVLDANGCTGTTTTMINQPPVLNASVSSFTNPTCNGITDGTINVTATGGTGPIYNFILYPGAVGNLTGQFTNLGQGVYTIVVGDANGCTTFVTQVLSIPTLNFTVNTINNLACTCVGSIGITNVNGGAGPYNYAISPVANQPVPGTFDNMCAGIYTITVTDVNNCSGTTVFNFNQIQLNTTAVNSQCNGVNDGSINCTALFGAAPYTYTLNPGNIVNASGIFTNLAADIYTIDVTDANTCNNSTTVTIMDNTQINVSLISIDSVICGIDGGASFAANGNAAGPYQYMVIPGALANATGIFTLGAGTYTLVVSNMAGCMKASPFDIIQVSALLPVAITSNVYDESCYLSGDGAIDIIPANPNGLSYLWNTGAVTQDLSNITSGNYEVEISNIGGDCAIVYDTITNIGAVCGTVSGNVYHDANSNCVNDAGDNSASNIMLQLSNGALAFSNITGDYQFSNVPYGNYVISHNANAFMMPNACTQPANLTISAGNNNLMNNDFKDSTSTISDADVYVFCGGVVPGFNSQYEVYVWNNSPLPMAGDLSFTLNNNLTLNYTLPSNQGVYPVATGDSIVWTNINVAPFSYGTFYVSFFTPAALPLGSLVESDAKIYVTNFVDNIPANNYYLVQTIAQGAFDPNDKSVNPIGEGPNGNITLNDSILNYQVRFQNTGTDTAHNIYILDTLSDKVDITTLKVTAFRHPYKVEILNSNILKFKFDNIMLPDSNINEPLSHGYIAYRIGQKNTNQVGDVINNTASIYFDFNAPIVTNTTINTIAVPALLSSPEFEKYIHVYPNPATDKINVEFTGNSNVQSSITLTNTLGQVVKTVLAKTINGKNNIELSVKEFPKGIYLLKLTQGKNHSMKKVVIE